MSKFLILRMRYIWLYFFFIFIVKNTMSIEKINELKITPTLEKGFVYCAFNKQNEKIYIGYTQTLLKNRIKAHYWKAKNRNDSENYFHNALKKYEKSDFEWFVLFESCELEKLKNKESEFISLFQSNQRELGYNLTSGGEQSYFNEEVCKKISKKAKERNLSGNKNPFFGKTHSKEQKEKWSNERKGKLHNPNFKNHSEETKKLLSEIIKEICKDPIHREKLSKSKTNNKPIKCVETNQIFHSIGEASRQLNINIGSIKNQLKGRSKTAGGLTFKFQ